MDTQTIDMFAYEEVESSFGYPPDYGPKGIDAQVKLLRKRFPGIGGADESIASKRLPDGAEACFAIPRWEKVADTYCGAVQKVLDQIKRTRGGKFRNYLKGKLGPQYLRQHERTVAMFKRLGDQQSGYDILMVPAQFGLQHRGCSVRRALVIMGPSESGLGSFHVACILLTHPKRLQHYDDLWIDCPGDKYAPGADRDFLRAPCFEFYDGAVKFDTTWLDNPSAYYGSASGVVPQS